MSGDRFLNPWPNFTRNDMKIRLIEYLPRECSGYPDAKSLLPCGGDVTCSGCVFGPFGVLSCERVVDVEVAGKKRAYQTNSKFGSIATCVT